MVYLKNVVSLALDDAACTGCGRCAVVCPHAVFVMDAGRSRIGSRDACMECGACARNCPAGAIRVIAGAGCATGGIRMLLGRKRACAGASAGCRTGGRPHE